MRARDPAKGLPCRRFLTKRYGLRQNDIIWVEYAPDRRTLLGAAV